MTLYGFDALTVNTSSTAAFNDPNMAFFLAKCTEGEGFFSSSYANLIQLSRDKGKLTGAYHFAWLNQDPIKEVTFFISKAGLKPGEIGVLDIEDWGVTDPNNSKYAADKAMRDATSWAQRVSYTLAWCKEYTRVMGVKPLIYANWNYITGLRTAATQTQWDELTQYPLWLAEWTLIPGKHSTVSNKDKSNEDDWPIIMHQYAAPSGIDKNFWQFDRLVWQALAIPQPPVVIPPPTEFDQIMAVLKANGSTLDSLSTRQTTLVNSTNDMKSGLDRLEVAIPKQTTDIVAVMDDQFQQVFYGQAAHEVALAETNMDVDKIIPYLEIFSEDVRAFEADVNNNFIAMTTEFSELKGALNTLPAVIKTAVGEGLGGFSLTVTYPKTT